MVIRENIYASYTMEEAGVVWPKKQERERSHVDSRSDRDHALLMLKNIS